MLKALFWVQRRLGSAQSAAGFRRRPGVLFAGALSGKLFRRQRTVCALDTAAGRCPVSISLCLLQGSSLSGRVCGGNIRCTLKLTGTPWQPDPTGRVLFLESYSGSFARMETMLHQYRQMEMFSRCSGVLLGNFSELAEKQQLPTLYRLVQDIIDDPALPIAVTTELGHQPEAHCLAYEGIRLEGSQL